MLWSGLVRVRRTSRFWLEYQFCLRNIWKRPQLIWRVENRWKHLQVLLKMTTVWLELQSAALLAVLIIINIIILLFFHWSIISSMSLFSLCVAAWKQSVDSSFPRLLVSCPLRGVSSRSLCRRPAHIIFHSEPLWRKLCKSAHSSSEAFVLHGQHTNTSSAAVCWRQVSESG